jgi:hypothetical protein
MSVSELEVEAAVEAYEVRMHVVKENNPMWSSRDHKRALRAALEAAERVREKPKLKNSVGALLRTGGVS